MLGRVDDSEISSILFHLNLRSVDAQKISVITCQGSKVYPQHEVRDGGFKDFFTHGIDMLENLALIGSYLVQYKNT